MSALAPGPAGADRATILVVDDTPDNLVLLSALLKDEYRVRVANNGEKALRLASAVPPPDVILLDVVMPGLDGYEVCRRLKADPATRAIPILFLTAHTEIEDVRRGLDLGAADYITKPISPPLLLTRIGHQLRLKAFDDFMRDREDFLEREVARRARLEVARLLARAPGEQGPGA